MCLSPIMLPEGIEVSCRKCRICIDNVTKDWVGRCLAESKTSVATHSVTLTYGRDSNGVDRHERATVLTYSDVQIWLKRLRNKGYPCRYLIAGEYGTQKGRAHWHGIIFWQKEVPPHQLYKMFNDDLWTHGHQLWKNPTPQHTKYCCKYIRKDQEDHNAQGKFVMSKVPHIGARYFEELAVEMVKKGIVPHGPFYRFPEAKKKDGTPVEFYLRGVAADKFAEAYVAAWYMYRKEKHLPNSEWLDAWCDKQVDEWRMPDIWPRERKSLEAVEVVTEAAERIEARRKHNEYYFGKNMRGFYDIDWTPDDE